jgi:acyl-coenzyme A thioesterase PaaI-like protein
MSGHHSDGVEERAVDEQSDWIRMDDEGFIELVGPIYYLPFKDRVGRFRFTPDSRHRYESDLVNTGMLMTFADRSLGTTARQADMTRRQATVQLDVHFVRPALIGDTIDLECRVLRETRSLVFVDGVMSARGDTIATAKGVWKILSGRSRAAENVG